MVLPILHLKVEPLIGVNTRMVRAKDMEHISMLLEANTLGKLLRMKDTGMEYSNAQMELYIKDNSNRIITKVMHITGMQVAKSIMDSSRMIRSMERELNKRKASYIELNMMKTNVLGKRNNDYFENKDVI